MGFSGAGAVRSMATGGFQAVVSAGTGAGLASAIAAGGKISIGPGTFLLDSAIPLVGSLEIQGAGPGKTILKHSGTTLHTLLSGTSISKITIRDLTLDGDQANVSTYDADRWAREPAIDLSAVTDLFISNVEMTAHRGQAIYGTGCSRVRIEGCWIHDTDNWGSIFKATDDIVYVNCHVENVYTHGLYVDGYNSASGSSRVKFIGNTVINTQYDSAHAASGVGISVQKGNSAGVYDVLCIGNICKGNGSMGFSMTPGSANAGYAGRMVIGGNVSEDHLNTGPSATGVGYELIGSEITLFGNVSKNNTYGITAQDSKGLVICSNRLLATIGSSQIHCLITPAGLTAQVEDLVFSGNLVQGGTGFQISTTATTNPHKNYRIEANNFLYCEYGVLMQQDCTNMAICGNTIDANHASVVVGRGIYARGQTVTIISNTIWSKTDRSCITVVDANPGLIVVENNVFLSGNYAIQFAVATTECFVSGNRVATMTTATTLGKNNVTTWRDAGNNTWNYVTAAPTTEYWHVGTKVYDTGVAAAGNIGWVCTTAGAPGTWKTWGAVAA